MFELAMANGLIDIVHVPKPHKVVAALEDGKQLPFPVLREIYEAYVCFLRRCEEYFLSTYSPPDGITSVGAHIALEAEIYLSSLPPEQRRIRQLIFDCLLKRETCVTGCDSMDDVDLLEMGSYDELQGGNISLPNGYSAILEPVAKHIPKDRILIKHAVTKIRQVYNNIIIHIRNVRMHQYVVTKIVILTCYLFFRWQKQKCSQDDVDLTEKSNSKSNSLIEVQCENGKTITAEHVVCTLPLGVLKRTAQDLFEPSLPAYKLEAINRLMFGTVNKIFLEYERPFLNPGVSEVMLLWDDERLSETEKRDISKTWFRKIYSFIKISETLLLGWISGRAAEYVEKLSTTEVAEVCTTILRRFLNDPFVPTPKNCLCTTWHSQPYTRGSYTAMAVGASQLDIRSLAEPLVQEKTEDETVKILVAFAGEHTHSSFYSTVHGAYLTGRTAADLLLGTKQSEKHALSLSCEDTSDLSSWIQGISLN